MYWYKRNRAKCTECYDDSSFTNNNNLKCVNRAQFLKENNYHYYIDDKNVFQQCNDNCIKCAGASYFDRKRNSHHNCITCPLNSFYVISGDYKTNCLSSCSLHSLFLIYNTTNCAEKCELDYKYTYNTDKGKQCIGQCALYQIAGKDECVDICSGNYPLILNDKTCVDKCPIGTKEIKGKCISFIESVNDTFAKINNTKEEVLLSLKQLKDLYLLTNKTIQGNNFTFQCYPLNSSLPRVGSTSAIDLHQCTNLLNNSNKDYSVEKFDIQREKAANQIEYAILDSKGDMLNLSLCQGLNATIKYTIDPLSFGIDISTVVQMASQGIDVFDPEDPFFNDICYPYTTNSSTDIPLKDRRKDIFKNVSLCDSDCSYKGFDAISYEVTCDCAIKTEITLSIEKPSVPLYTSLLESTNIMIVRCYKLLFKIENYFTNIGFWISCTLYHAS